MVTGGIFFAAAVLLATNRGELPDRVPVSVPVEQATLDTTSQPPSDTNTRSIYPVFSKVVKAGAEIVDVKIAGGDEPAVVVSLRWSL